MMSTFLFQSKLLILIHFLTQSEGVAISDESFEVLWKLMKVILIETDIYNDYSSAKLLMHMGSTYFRNVDGTAEYIQNRLKYIGIWKKPRYWDYAFYDAVASERAKTIHTNKDWREMSSDEQDEFSSR
jgi:hypothetical protein